MAKLEVPPTKSSLLALERSLEFAQEGYELLEQKRQILVLELMSRLEAAKRAQKDVDEAMAAAFAALREAALRSGTEALAREALGIVRRHKLDYRGRPVMGIDLPTVTAEHEAPKPEFSTASGSAASDDVMAHFTRALDALARLAEVENAVLRLASEVRRTQRRVNALDKVFIPDYQETVNYIEDVLEEREREQFVIMKMAKGQA
ncbi:MAG TPA: V-type ATP synthase subunit D [Planctomycetota bacterium]|nr:V-type ATP synthase subunit D [Planctomycetota bacterium]HRR78923.1 V-type ATP synthase subunit D [Planctomycetota bacterium]HRT92799.1 V-type ATP synthase subunit D [Planctomycetota bacterium]